MQWKKNISPEEREKWNTYCRENRKKRLRWEEQESKDIITELNISSDLDSLTFKAATVVAFMILTGITNPTVISKRLSFDNREVRLIFRNWADSDMEPSEIIGMIASELKTDSVLFTLSLTLIAMLGAGKVVRKEIIT